MPLKIDSDVQNTHEARFEAAMQFMADHAAQHLDDAQLVSRCAAALMDRYDISHRVAANDAIHALAALQARERPAYVDINHSTSRVVYVMSPRTGRMVAFTASELLTLADEHRATLPDAQHAAMRCGRAATP